MQCALLQAYMSAYLDSEGKAPKKDKLYYAFFKSFVKLRCLQADRLGSLEERVERLQEVLQTFHSATVTYMLHCPCFLLLILSYFQCLSMVDRMCIPGLLHLVSLSTTFCEQ